MASFLKKGGYIDSNLIQEIQIPTTDDFYVLFPVEGNVVNTITVRIKDGVAELSAGASSHRAFVISRLKEYKQTFYECSSREDFDFKYLAYKLTGDPTIFEENSND